MAKHDQHIHKDRLSALRAAIKAQGLAGFIIPRMDKYQGEFVSPAAERLAWLSGFTGSAGTAVVLADQAVVLSDGRYTIQMEQQVDAGLFETGNSTKISVAEWLIGHCTGGDIIGYDPWLHTPDQIEKTEEALEGKNIQLKALASNPVDALWEKRPAEPMAKAEVFPEDVAGVSTAEKRGLIAKQLAKEKVFAAVLTLPDSIAWLLNIRGGDIECTPVVLSFAVIDRSGLVSWFVNPEKITSEVRKHLGNSVQIIAPEKIEEYMALLAKDSKKAHLPVALDFKRSPVWFKRMLAMHGADVQNLKDPCILPKAMKTQAEQKAIAAAHVRDGLALARFLCWLDEEAPKGKLTEISVAEKLESFRAQDPAYRGPSFATIAGFAGNGAIVHYRATETTNKDIVPPGLLLLDSGGQYKDGTTDITRTIAIGEPTEEMRRNFTLVLKGHIAVARAHFPEGTLGSQIDALARQPLWNVDLDYAHGTGHGVGCYLSVHEEAASLSTKGQEPLRPGMLLSNEPGYYKAGEYGIRIENLVLVKQGKDMMYFETVSLVPIDRRLIDKKMLSPDEIAWIDEYHGQVRQTLAPTLEERVRAWLERQTSPL